MKVLMVLLGCALSAVAQPIPVAQEYIVVQKSSLTGTAEVITIQQPSSGAQNLQGLTATIYSTVQLEFTIERDCTTPATATALTISRVNSITIRDPTATAWRSSNATGCTVLSRNVVGANGTLPIDMTTMVLTGPGTTKNWTIRTESTTATVIINVKWIEKAP